MKHFIITGAKHAGKTTFAYNLSKIIIADGLSVGGFLCTGTFKNGTRDKFFIKSLNNNSEILIADTNKNIDKQNYSFGSFTFYQQGFDFAYKEYNNSLLTKKNIIIIDEIGKWELQGGGFASLFYKMPVYSILLVVCRYDFTSDVNSLFFNNYANVIDINSDILLSAKNIKYQFHTMGIYD